MAIMQLLPMVETIIVTKLKNPDKAVEIYKAILAKSKDARLNKVLQKRIDKNIIMSIGLYMDIYTCKKEV